MNEPTLTQALHDLVRDPVVPPSLGTRVAAAHARRRRAVTVVGVTALTAAAVAAVLVLPGADRRGAPQPASSPTGAPRPALLAGSGYVTAWPGEPVRFCEREPLESRPLVTDDDGFPLPAPPRCLHGVVVEGADLDRLFDRSVDGGTVSGTAWLAGAYRDGTLHVMAQDDPREPPGSPFTGGEFPVPCAEPPGGWAAAEQAPLPPGEKSPPGREVYVQPDIEPALRWGRQHPGQLVNWGYRQAARDRPVLVLAATDPEVVEKALARTYPRSLCVIRARYTEAQLTAARIDALAFVKATGAEGGEMRLSRDGQALVWVKVQVVDDEVRAFLARHPEGLIGLESWLQPVR